MMIWARVFQIFCFLMMATSVAAVAGPPVPGKKPPVQEEKPYDLKDYPSHARISIGDMQVYTVGEEDALLDIARHFNLGYVEIRAANPDVDPWAPVPGGEVIIPSFHLLPRAQQEGIVVNLSDMRLYYFETPGAVPLTFPIGIGREGLATPEGETKIVKKIAGPSWYPTPRMREEKPWLPVQVKQGAANPLGTHALYLGWPTFLIHGSNKPWAIGRRVSSGCMRMYPEDIKTLFERVPVDTRVTVVDQPVLIGWVNEVLYLEAIPDKAQSYRLEMGEEVKVKPLDDKTRQMIKTFAGAAADRIDWPYVETVLQERRGYPVSILRHEKSSRKNRHQDEYYN